MSDRAQDLESLVPYLKGAAFTAKTIEGRLDEGPEREHVHDIVRLATASMHAARERLEELRRGDD